MRRFGRQKPLLSLGNSESFLKILVLSVLEALLKFLVMLD